MFAWAARATPWSRAVSEIKGDVKLTWQDLTARRASILLCSFIHFSSASSLSVNGLGKHRWFWCFQPFILSLILSFKHSFIHTSLYFVCRFSKEWKPSLKKNDTGNQVIDSITFAFIHLIIPSFLPSFVILSLLYSANSFYEWQTADIKIKNKILKMEVTSGW